MSTGWTTCVAIADLDADGDADLFLSRYAGGPEVATRECTDREGKPGVCRPTLFPAEETCWPSDPATAASRNCPRTRA